MNEVSTNPRMRFPIPDAQQRIVVGLERHGSDNEVYPVNRCRAMRLFDFPRSMLATQSSRKHCRMARHRMVRFDLGIPVTRHEESGRAVDVMRPHEPQDPQDAWLAVAKVEP